ncbi:hypothetical protein [Planococcus dechangensis]|uniref:Uncharacterized protein n=1 Tax=Planococcus dechangensis TaxID=1176255 RepID=A0ABV9MG23_9BACL
MEKKKAVMGALLAVLLAATVGLPQATAASELSQGEVTINGPQVLPPL